MLRTSSGTWQSLTGATMPGSDVIYNNTIPTPLFSGMGAGQTWYTGGRVPSPTSHAFTGLIRPGCATQYLISGFEFGYCTDQPSIDVEVEFYDSFLPCAFQHVEPIKALIALPGLPGSPSPGTQVCYTVCVDLRGPGGGQTFWLLADGDGTFQGITQSTEQFGFGFRVTNLVGTNTGPLLAGHGSAYIANTRWMISSADYSQPGLGLGLNGNLCIHPQNACVDLDPQAEGLHLRLFSDACGALVGNEFCTGDGGAAPCPCANASPTLNREGCRSSVNGVNGGRFEATGMASLSNDSVTLKSIRLPSTTSVLYFQGTAQRNGGQGAAFGDGLRCAGGTLTRIATTQASVGEASYPGPGSPSVSFRGAIFAPGTRTYQGWYRNAAAFCTSAAFNLTNGWEIAWQP